MIQLPVEVLLGKRVGFGVAEGLAFQATWALGLAALNRLVLLLAVRKVVIQGG
jgi:ABC-2 type transport system permease protein